MSGKSNNPKLLAELKKGVLAGDRTALARAITLVESTRAEDKLAAVELIEALLPNAGKSIRIGVTGIPGVGKSTFIEALGLYLVGEGRRVGVLAVDPSSSKSGGSILGDKTRMSELAAQQAAFIRPSPTSGQLGGVAAHSREAMLLLEAAGYDVILVETVGAGQSEVEVAGMVDCFLVLQLPGAGDELQGIKKGVLELADIVVVNKAEQDNKERATLAVRDLKAALQIVTGAEALWRPPVLMASALEKIGIKEAWQAICEFEKTSKETGQWHDKRSEQNLFWMWAIIEAELRADFRANRDVNKALASLKKGVKEGRISAPGAARRLLGEYLPK